MNKKSGAFALAVLVVVVVLGSLVARKMRPTEQQELTASTDADAMVQAQSANSITASDSKPVAAASNTKTSVNVEASVPQSQASPIPAMREPVARLMPPLETERAEVAKDPHGTPDSVVKFSLGLGERLDAVKNDDEASALMEELDECVTKTEKKVSTAVKSLCLLNARKLAKKFPSMEAKYSNLEKRADADIRSNVGFFK